MKNKPNEKAGDFSTCRLSLNKLGGSDPLINTAFAVLVAELGPLTDPHVRYINCSLAGVNASRLAFTGTNSYPKV